MLFESLLSHPAQKIALQDQTQTVLYGDLNAEVEKREASLSDVSVLGIALDNSVDWVLWDLAALKAGIPVVPVPPFFVEGQVNHLIQTSAVSHMATPAGLQPTGINDPTRLFEGTAKVTYTSGTTGEPKGVCLPRKAMEAVAQSILDVLGQGFVESHLCVLPLAVLLENVAGVYAGLLAGCTIQLTPLTSFGTLYSDLHDQLTRHRTNSVILVPEILRGLMKQVAQKGPLPNLKFVAVGGSKVDPALLQQAQALGLPVYEGYGLSECASVVSLNTPNQSKPGTVGKPLPHVQATVLDGEIHIKNPGFLGYVGEAAPETFATGDLGAIDDDGFLSISGRAKNVLITSYGRNVSPEWVEATLLANPEIAQAVVYGDGQPHLSALLVQTSANADAEAAVARTNAALPDYAQIMDFKLVPPFTVQSGLLTGTGRPRRDAILSLYAKETSSMSFYDRLVAETASARAGLYHVPQLVDGLRGSITRDTYIAYLTEAFHHVSHTVPFLMTMGSKLPPEKKRLHKAIASYISEEIGHEEWILNDIAAAGGDKEAARQSKPNLETQVLIAYNYDYMTRKNPVGFLGMVFMLESTSIEIANHGASAVKEKLGLPEEAFSYLFSHGELDISHMKFYEELVNTITDPDDQAAIIEVAQNTFRLFANLLRAIPHEGNLSNAA
ncbi:AMP-binding protein [Aestuariispira ectoiniformans]|uniref:AMP-binding protein n=1 Tax=Aestuariispira ectoiniformans TaxID=2775080 RepID=UPI00223A8D5D|nr:AMP-binding protein [Aestuariispira ectoiniformans]